MGRMLRLFPRGCALAAVLLTGPLAGGQSTPVTQAQTVIDVLHQLSDKADVIFAGQVMAIRRPDDGVVEVEFRVDQAIRGCVAGTPYILREWAGLWAGDSQRYRVGQRVLMLLHAPSAAGMSSPVGGLDGAIPIHQGGTATPLADAAAPAPAPFVDLRWLGAKLSHAVSYRSEPAPAAKTLGLQASSFVRQGTMRGAAADSVTSGISLTAMASHANAVEGSVAAQQASVDAVVGMLTSWQKAQHVAP